MNALEIFKVLNWLMSQYRKTIVAEFFFKKKFTSLRNDPFVEIDSIVVAKICWNLMIFSKHFLCKSITPVSSFSQHDKPITRKRNLIDFGGYFIYGGHSGIIHAKQKV